MNKNKIYIVKVGSILSELEPEKNNHIIRFNEERTWLYTKDDAKAIDFILENRTDISEGGYYKFAAFEEVIMDDISIYPVDATRKIYVYNEKTNKFSYLGYENYYINIYSLDGIVFENKEFEKKIKGELTWLEKTT